MSPENFDSAYSAATGMDPVSWWTDYGGGLPHLQPVAQKVMTLPPTAAGGERNFSAWKHIWSDHRSRLLVGRVGMLVYIYFNQRALNNVQNKPSAQDGEKFLDYLQDLPPMPATEGASTLSDVYENAMADQQAQETAAAAAEDAADAECIDMSE